MVHNRSGNYQPSQWHLLVLSSSSQIRRGPDVAAAAAAAGTCARQLCFFIAMMHFTERTASHRSLHRGFSRSSWSSVRNHQRYVHRSRDWTAHGPNREGPRLDYRRIPPPLRSPMIPPTRISSLTSRFENFCTPLGNFPPSSAFDRFRPYQLSSSFLSLSTLAAISIYSCSSFPPPLPYLPPNANAAPFVPPRLIFYNFIERCWHRIVERVDAIVHEDSHANVARCLWNFSFLFGSPYRRGWPVLWNYRSSTANRMDGWTVDDRSSVFRLENIFPWNFARSRSSSSSRDGVAEVTGEKIWGGLGNSALKTWRCLTPRLSETCLRGLYSTYGSLVVYKGVVAL